MADPSLALQLLLPLDDMDVVSHRLATLLLLFDGVSSIRAFLSLCIFEPLLIAAGLVTWEGGRAAFSSGLCLVGGTLVEPAPPAPD